MPFTVKQVQKDKATGKLRLILLWPKVVTAGEVVYPIPPWDKRKWLEIRLKDTRYSLLSSLLKGDDREALIFIDC
jgi:hypothetical protein